MPTVSPGGECNWTGGNNRECGIPHMRASFTEGETPTCLNRTLHKEPRCMDSIVGGEDQSLNMPPKLTFENVIFFFKKLVKNEYPTVETVVKTLRRFLILSQILIFGKF